MLGNLYTARRQTLHPCMLKFAYGWRHISPHSDFWLILVSLWLAGFPAESSVSGYRRCVHISWRGEGSGGWGIHLCLHLETRVLSVPGWNRQHRALCRKFTVFIKSTKKREMQNSLIFIQFRSHHSFILNIYKFFWTTWKTLLTIDKTAFFRHPILLVTISTCNYILTVQHILSIISINHIVYVNNK